MDIDRNGVVVPYPLGFYTKWMDGRIDDPNGGWKGRDPSRNPAPFRQERPLLQDYSRASQLLIARRDREGNSISFPIFQALSLWVVYSGVGGGVRTHGHWNHNADKNMLYAYGG